MLSKRAVPNQASLRMIAEQTKATNELDYVIELSILKIRRMQITGIKDERQKLLVLETLHNNIVRKIRELEAQSDGTGMDRTGAFLTILHDTIQKLGLSSLIRFGVNLPDDIDGFPRLKLAMTRKTRDLGNAPNISQGVFVIKDFTEGNSPETLEF